MKTIKNIIGIVGAGLLLASQAQAQSFLEKGLIAYYPFNGGAVDESGHGNDLILNGGQLTTDRFGAGYRAMSFDGVNQELFTRHNEALNFPGGDLTISLWIALADTNKTQCPIGKYCVYGSGSKWQVQYGPSAGQTTPMGFSFYVTNAPTGEAGWYAASDRTLFSNLWYHVLVRKAAAQYDLFINGALASSGTGMANMPQDINAEMAIGECEKQGWVNGKIDDVRVYNRAFSDAEVAKLYEMETGPWVDVIQAVKPSFFNLTLNRNYQLQLSTNMKIWTNYGSPFTATNTSIEYRQYWDVDGWNRLFFRLKTVP